MGRSEDSDARLLARVPAPEAVAALYERHVDAVFRFAVRRCRPGMVFVDTLDPFRFELIIDPATGRLLQWSRTVLHRSPLAPRWQPGLVNRATYETVAVVPSTRAR